MNNNTRIRSKDMPAAERNRCLDFFKGIAAVCVVFVHIPFHGTFGKCISSIGSCGVMLFFLISGYYAFGERDKMCRKLRKRFCRNLLIKYDPFRYNITQIFKLMLVASVFLFALEKPKLIRFTFISGICLLS